MKRYLQEALSSTQISSYPRNQKLIISNIKAPLLSLSSSSSSSSAIRSTQPQTSCRQVHTVVMVRHGESLWNQEKRFTGWCDVPLTRHGEADAKDAGLLMVIIIIYQTNLINKIALHYLIDITLFKHIK